MRRVLPSTSALQCFEAAALLGSFTQAAQDLNLSQSAVSKQIRVLEDLLGLPLFERKRQRVFLTPAGHHYLSQIQPLLQKLEGETLALRTYDQVTGALNFGSYPTLASRWLLPHLMAFGAAFPDLNCNSITYQDNSQLDPASIDIGIVQGLPPWPGWRADFLMAEDLVAVVSPSLLPAALSDPDDLFRFRRLQHTTRPRTWDIWFETLGRRAEDRGGLLLFSQFETIIEATVAGQGIAILPLLLVRRELKDGRLLLAHPHVARPPSGYYLVAPEAKVGSPKVEAARDWFLQQASDPQSPSA
ncbi:LysR substrate-binding domain-containing protein [Rhodovibrionaceae bacterium A322]